MSTKSTLARDDAFHFYRDVFDEDHVYLELRSTRFSVEYGRVRLPIPLQIWEVIRHLGAADLSLADSTDDDLSGMIESEVDQRIAAYLAAGPNSPDADWLRYAGSFVYGSADSPRDRQIEDGREYYGEQRERQRKLRDAIEVIRRRR